MVGTEQLYRRRLLMVVSGGILLVGGMCLYPPWAVHSPHLDPYPPVTHSVGYALLWRGPERDYEEAIEAYPIGSRTVGEVLEQRRERFEKGQDPDADPRPARWRVGTRWFYIGDRWLTVHLDIGRLVLQCVPVVGLVAIGVLTLRLLKGYEDARFQERSEGSQGQPLEDAKV